MRALIIDEDAKKSIEKVITFTKNHRITSKLLAMTLEGKYPPVGDYEPHTCRLFDGFKVAFSLEEQSCGWCRHLSVSIDSLEKLPSVPAVETIMKEFGFTGTITDCLYVWIEKDIAVNVLQRISEESSD